MLKKIKDNKIEIATKIYILAMSMYLGVITFRNTAYFVRNEAGTIGTVMTLLELAAMALLCVRLVLNPPIGDKRTNVFYVIMFLAFLVSGFAIGHKFFVLTALIFIATADIEAKTLTKTILIIQGGITLVVLGLSLVGVTENYAFYQEGRMRYTLGFSWTTILPITVFFLTLGYIYLRSEKFKWYEGIPLLALNYILFYYTNTRMTFCLGALAIVFFMLHSIFKGLWKFWEKLKWLLILVPCICAVIAFLTAILYDPEVEIWVKLDQIMSNRLHLGHDGIKQFGVTLFGQEVEWVGLGILNDGVVYGYNYIDSSYIQLFITYGLIPFIIIMGIYSMGIWKGIKKNDYWMTFVLIFVALHSITEPHLINIAENALVLLPFAKVSIGGCDV